MEEKIQYQVSLIFRQNVLDAGCDISCHTRSAVATCLPANINMPIVLFVVYHGTD